MKATAIAPSNIAFIKYWGKKEEVLRLPENGSVSMCLSNLLTTTTVEFALDYKEDSVDIWGDKGNEGPSFAKATEGKKDGKEGVTRIIKHLDRIRKLAGIKKLAKVVSINNYPASSGLASSASGFAALTVAGAKAAGLQLSEKELSILARQGSGSACRSIPDGFIEWLDGGTTDTSYGVSLFPPEYWDICDVAAIVSEKEKDVSSTDGQTLTKTNPFFQTRLLNINNKIEKIKELIKKKNFTEFGELVETEALELHAILLTSKPPLIYWNAGTLKIIKNVQKWRKEELEAYFTIDAGPQVHIIVEKKNVSMLCERLKTVEETKEIIVNEPASGARLTEEHLF